MVSLYNFSLYIASLYIVSLYIVPHKTDYIDVSPALFHIT
jgi:hypothetical protein